MFEKVKETVRNWFSDPRIAQLVRTVEIWHDNTYDRFDKINRRIDTSESKINIISDGIDKNAEYFNNKFRDLVDLRMRIE